MLCLSSFDDPWILIFYHHLTCCPSCLLTKHSVALLLPPRPASSTTAALAGTGSTPWTSWATTGPSCATRRTGTPARTDGSRHAGGPEEERPSRRGEATRQGEHVCRKSLSTRAPWHPTRHWGYHCRKCSLLHLLHFCCCSQWHYAQWLWERQGALHTYAFSQNLWPDGKMGVSLRLRSGRKCHFFFLFVYMCCIVKSNHASLIAVHWQMPYSAFKFLFSPLPPFPNPQLASVFSCASQLVFLTFGSWMLGFI